LSKKFLTDYELLKKVFLENRGYCLCAVGLKCPCHNFLREGECRCGVYRPLNEDSEP